MALTAEGTSKFVQAGDVKIHYHEAGSGEAVICIHGGAPGAYGWGNFGRNMEALAAQYRTFIVDLPGYGKSDKPEVTGGRYGFYARVFKDMLDALGIDKAHIIGLATGGAAAIKMALDYPDRIGKLVLVSSAGGMPMFMTSPSEGQKVINSYYAPPGPSREKMRNYLQTIMYDSKLITDEFIDERYEASIQPEFMASAPEGRPSATVNTEPLWKDLDQIKSPTLVMWGRDNRVQTYDNALFMLNRIPDVQVVIFGKTGLWIPIERAEEFNRYTLGFLGA
jgi:4,5:9,10-diseco-3-hydroxy-5,9,17-trioxoandrosta-1(10),2-diene-4-oate hydrolase